MMNNACCKEEFNSLEFKAAGMDTEDYAFPNVKSENEIPLDQPEFYLEDSKAHLKTLLQNDKICQLCKQICTHSFSFVKDLESDITCNLNIPQVNFGLTNESVICSSCHHALTTDRHFLGDSSEIRNSSEEKDSSSYVKIEDIQMKTEADEAGNTPNCHDELLEGQTSRSHGMTHETLLVSHHPTYEDGSATHKHQCTCGYKTNTKQHFERHQLTYKNDPEAQKYKCDACNYESTNKNYLTRHKLVHKDSGEVRMYKCETCAFQTKHKRSLAKHQVTHDDKSNVHMYKCPSCAYETNRKQNFHRHQIKHKSAGEVPMYTCGTCRFQTKHEKYLATHQLTHQDNSQIYVCNSCDYRTNRQKNLHRHQTKHQATATVRMYKCDACRYQSKSKNHLARHKLLVHRDSADVRMYKCGVCEFQTKHEQYLATHQLRHSITSEAQMYKCTSCAYETVQKRYLQRHQMKHKSGDGERVHKCNTCGYESRYEQLFELHRLGNGLEMYKCGTCGFEARNKKCVGHHELVHKDDVPGVSKCDGRSDNINGNTSPEMDNARCSKEFQPFEFKAVSMDIEDSISPYVKSENPEDSKEQLKTLLENGRICQLCKQICSYGFTLVKDLESDLTSNLSIPEVNFNSIIERVVCSSCLDPLNTQRNILKNSSNLRDLSKEKEDPVHIKTEEIEMKPEGDENMPECDDKRCEGQISPNHRVMHQTLPNHDQSV